MNVSRHIDKILNSQSDDEVQKNRLRLAASIYPLHWLTLQGCALRGNDESMHSRNRGNFLELIKFIGMLRPDIGEVVFENAPGNAKFTSPMIQKEILRIIANKVRKNVLLEIGDAKFCCLVDESKDSTNKEQMAIVLRFVDNYGIMRERFFDIIHVVNTTSSNLKKEICDSLIRSNLDVKNLRGQGYDGASNMRGAWNGLQALFLRDCPSAYYIHCFTHRLQLALVAAIEKETSIYLFFQKLTTIVNYVKASPKRHNELQSNQAYEIRDSIASGKRDTSKRVNQIGTLHRAGTTRWSSDYDSIYSLIDMYTSILMTLQDIQDEGTSNSTCGDAASIMTMMQSFDFIYTLHTMHKIIAITDLLSKSLQQKVIDILSVSLLRAEGVDSLMEGVIYACTENDIDIPDMSARYKKSTSRLCQQTSNITVGHHYHFDIFNNAIDFQLQELNNRFSDESIELLRLSTALDPKDNFKSFNIDNICTLAKKNYACDFTAQDMHFLKSQLIHYGYEVITHQKFQRLSTLSELCQKLIDTNKSKVYFLIKKLIRLILTLPVSTATTERAFSTMKYVKSILRNKMEGEFFKDSMTIYIERDFSLEIDVEAIIDDFYSQKTRRVQLK